MAISKVRAQFNGQWYTLTLNSATGRYEARITPTDPSFGQSGGYYNVTVEVTNSSGKVVTANGSTMEGLRLVVSEITAPTLTLMSPPSGYLNTGKPTVVFTAVDEGSGVDLKTLSVTLDGTAVTGISTTAITNGYRISVTPATAWADGAHTLKLQIADANGNVSALNVNYVVDTTAPLLDVTSPQDGEIILGAETVTVSGTVEDATSGVASVTINGEAVDVVGVGFSKEIPLAEGRNLITVEATDVVGNKAAIQRTAIRDTSPPVLTVTYPADGGFVTASSFVVAGTAADEGSGVDFVTVNGAAAELAANGTFQFPVTLADGRHTLLIESADKAGYRSGVTLEITVDTVPPTLEAWETRRRLVVDDAFVTLTGRSGDATSPPVTVSVQNNEKTAGTAQVLPSGQFSLAVPLDVGLNEITVTARDGAGLTTTQSIPMVRLITDRTREDLKALESLLKTPVGLWTEEQKAAFAAGAMKGAYDFTDINRVVLAEQLLAQALDQAGTAVELTASGGWAQTDFYPAEEADRYLNDLAALRKIFPLPAGTPEVPRQLYPGRLAAGDGLTVEAANDMEAILVMTDSVFAMSGVSGFYAGEIFCGEV